MQCYELSAFFKSLLATKLSMLKVLPIFSGVIFNLVFFINGYKLTPDSIYYSSGAYNIYHFSKLSGFTSNIFDQFPIGMPLTLYPTNFLSPNTYVFFINSCATIAILISIRKLLKLFNYSDKSIAIMQMIYILSHAFINIYSMMWSEPIFNALSTYLFCLLIQISLNKKNDTKIQLTGSIVLMFCILYRTAGAIWIIVFITILLKLRVGIFKILILSLISVSPIIFQYFTQFRPNSLGVFGSRYSSTNSINQVLISFPKGIGNQVLPGGMGGSLGAIAIGLLVIVWMLLAHLQLISEKKSIPLFLALDSYLLLVIFSEIFTQIDPVGDRLLSPIYPILLVLAGEQMRRSQIFFNQTSRIAIFWIYALLISSVAGGALQLHSILFSSQKSSPSIERLGNRMHSNSKSFANPIFSTNPTQTFIDTLSLPILQFPLIHDYYTPPDKFELDRERLLKFIDGRIRIDVYCYYQEIQCLKLIHFVLKDYPNFKVTKQGALYYLNFAEYPRRNR